VFALFFFSGIAGLVYQVLWLRRLSLVCGVGVTGLASPWLLDAPTRRPGTRSMRLASRALPC